MNTSMKPQTFMKLTMSGAIQCTSLRAVHPVMNYPIGSKMVPGNIGAMGIPKTSVRRQGGKDRHSNVRSRYSGLPFPPFFL